MNKFIKFIILFLIILFAVSDSFARRRKRGDYFLRPQIGVWYGPVTPVGPTKKEVNTNLGGGGYFRYNTPWEPLKLGFDISYQHHESDGINELFIIPTYANLIYRLPIQMPLNFQIKAGAGVAQVRIKPSNLSQRDPMFMTGFEVSFPAGKLLNIGLRIDYLMIYEEHNEGAKRNGHVVNGGITVFFNL